MKPGDRGFVFTQWFSSAYDWLPIETGTVQPPGYRVSATEDKPRCHRCKHYYITWERRHPHGCRQWGFKSQLLPTLAVFQASGKDCQLFESKPKAPESS